MRRDFRNFDYVVAVCVVCIFVIGLFFLYSASSSLSDGLSRTLLTRQVLWMIFGLAGSLLILKFDYRRLMNVSFFLYAGNIVLLVLVFFLGSKRLGAQRWLTIAGFGFQPSEFIKITFILALATFLDRRRMSIGEPVNMIGVILLMLPSFLLIVLQPDLGTALVLIPVMLAMVFIAGVNAKGILPFVIGGLVSMPFFWHFLKDYQKKRLLVFMNPDLDPLGAGYTITQSKIAIGSGQFFGKGWLGGSQSQLNFLPERHTDFIFSVVGEEWGFIGGVIVILLFFVIFYRGIRIIEGTNDLYGKVIAAGIIALIAFQVVVNIGMTLGLLPVVGLTLPFISYGGSSLISLVLAIAILLNVGMRRQIF